MAGFFQWLVDWVWGFAVWVWDQAVVTWWEWWELAWSWIGMLLEYLWSLIPEAWVTFLSQVPWAQFKLYFDKVDTWFGIYTAFSVALVAAGIVGSIRLVRWVLSVIPSWITNAGS